jgi:hypothetical protein
MPHKVGMGSYSWPGGIAAGIARGVAHECKNKIYPP